MAAPAGRNVYSMGTFLHRCPKPQRGDTIGGRNAGYRIGSLGMALVRRNWFDTNEQVVLQERWFGKLHRYLSNPRFLRYF